MVFALVKLFVFQTQIKVEQSDDESKTQLAALQQENEELKNRIASLEKLSHQPESNDQTLHLQGNLKQEMLLKEAALAQLQTSHQHCRTLEESIAYLKSEISTLKSEHEKVEASWKQETTSANFL
jgi:phosphohistidine phosphatase SixA